jgi:ferritin-like metal-binding protein YciE
VPTPTLRALFIDHIRDLYDAEKQLTKALPKLVKAADSEALSKAIREHLEQTQNHVSRLEKVFATLRYSRERQALQSHEGSCCGRCRGDHRL